MRGTLLYSPRSEGLAEGALRKPMLPDQRAGDAARDTSGAGRHETDAGNLINEHGGNGPTRLHDRQCERARKGATAFGLAEAVR